MKVGRLVAAGLRDVKLEASIFDVRLALLPVEHEIESTLGRHFSRTVAVPASERSRARR